MRSDTPQLEICSMESKICHRYFCIDLCLERKTVFRKNEAMVEMKNFAIPMTAPSPMPAPVPSLLNFAVPIAMGLNTAL